MRLQHTHVFKGNLDIFILQVDIVLSHCKEIMHKLRLMTYPLGLSMDPTKGGLALQGAHHGHVGGHEFAFDPGFTERAAKFSTFGSSTTSYNLQRQPQPYSLYDSTTLSEPDCQPSSSSASFSAAARVSHSGARDRSQHLSELASEFEHSNHPEGLGIHPGLEAFEGADNSRGTSKMLVNNENNESSDLGEAHENSSCSRQVGKRKISSAESLADVEITCTRDSKVLMPTYPTQDGHGMKKCDLYTVVINNSEKSAPSP